MAKVISDLRVTKSELEAENDIDEMEDQEFCEEFVGKLKD